MPSLLAKGGLSEELSKAIVKRIGQPLPVAFSQNESSEAIQLIRLESDTVYFYFQGSRGEGSIKLDDLGEIRFRSPYTKAFLESLKTVEKGVCRDEDLQVMRDAVFPMIRFLGIPEEICGFHQMVSDFFDALLLLERYEEALLLVEYADMSVVDPWFLEKSVRLARHFLENEQSSLAAKAIALLPFKMVESSNNDELLYWYYYCQFKLKNYQDGESFVAQIQQLQPGTPYFSLQQLIVGAVFLQEENKVAGMKAISEGIIYASPLDPWTPELMYLSSQAYQALEQVSIAAAVYEETQKFFPNSSWSQMKAEPMQTNP